MFFITFLFSSLLYQYHIAPFVTCFDFSKTGNDLLTKCCPFLAFSSLRYGIGRKEKACKMLLLQAFSFVACLSTTFAVWTEYELFFLTD
jgi:hypothetical protein